MIINNAFGATLSSKPDRFRIYYQTSAADSNISTELPIEFISPASITNTNVCEIVNQGSNKEARLQYKLSHREPSSFTVYVDNSGVQNTSNNNVKVILDPLRDLLKPSIHGSGHKKPPMCRVVTGFDDIKGYIEKLEEEYVFFNSDGYPIRAKVTITLKPVSSDRAAEENSNTGNSRKAWIIKEGDRLDVLANRFFGNPALWKAIAEENSIENPFEFPRRDQLGQALIIPDEATIA